MTQEERPEVSGDVDVLEQAAATATRAPRRERATPKARVSTKKAAAIPKAVSASQEEAVTTPAALATPAAEMSVAPERKEEVPSPQIAEAQTSLPFAPIAAPPTPPTAIERVEAPAEAVNRGSGGSDVRVNDESHNGTMSFLGLLIATSVSQADHF